MNIYVGNLSFQATEEDVRSEFEKFGQVQSVKVIIDRMSGRSRGICFVEMEDTNEARNAIKNIDGKTIKNREVKVNEAQPKKTFSKRY
jgi:RNA recognition motif-containing protein